MSERASSDVPCVLCGAPAAYAYDAWGGVCCSSSEEQCPLGGTPIPVEAWEAIGQLRVGILELAEMFDGGVTLHGEMQTEGDYLRALLKR